MLFKIFILKIVFLIFHKTFLPVNTELLLTVKITLDVNDYMLLVHVVQELLSSLHVTRSFWCLIMAST